MGFFSHLLTVLTPDHCHIQAFGTLKTPQNRSIGMLIHAQCSTHPSQTLSPYPFPSYMPTMSPSRGERYFIYANVCQFALKGGTLYNTCNACSGAT